MWIFCNNDTNINKCNIYHCVTGMGMSVMNIAVDWLALGWLICIWSASAAISTCTNPALDAAISDTFSASVSCVLYYSIPFSWFGLPRKKSLTTWPLVLLMIFKTVVYGWVHSSPPSFILPPHPHHILPIPLSVAVPVLMFLIKWNYWGGCWIMLFYTKEKNTSNYSV